MQNFFKLILASSLLIYGTAHAQKTLQEAGEWMAHYYEKPSPDQVTQWIRDASAEGAFEKTSARFPMMIFVSEVFKRHPEKTAQWCKELATLPAPNKAYVGWSFRNADVPAQDACIRTQLGLSEEDQAKIFNAAHHDPLSKQPSKPGDLDMLWAVFMATGSEAAVNRIIDVLGRPSPEKGTPGSLDMIMLKGAAKWSLSSNIRQHQRVAEIAKARRAMESGELQKELDEAIKNAEKPTGGPQTAS